MSFEICPLEAAWGNWAEWVAVLVGLIAAAGTIWVAWLARNTSERAAAIAEEARKIAQQQHAEAVDMRKANARIVRRLIVHEISELPVNLHILIKRCDRVLEVGVNSERDNVFLEDTLRSGTLSLLPGTEKSEDRLHNLPEEMGNDLAVLVGYSRTLNAMSSELLQYVKVIKRPSEGFSGLTVYTGDLRLIETYKTYVEKFSRYAIPTAVALRDFTQVEPRDFSQFNVDGSASPA
ncbi:hypothetical protein ABE522_06100 [Stenotrophomonas pennii]|uniref:hypothetical protein n=1 Tax=Stenotrophomonas lacuserhaii TaxID=2760084 RepID=UPI00320A7733